jgi:single-stranded-DNA-specific exonuclease
MPHIPPVWAMPPPVSAVAARAAARAYGVGHPIAAAVLLRRALTGGDLAQYLRPDPSRLLDPAGLRNLPAAVRVLDEAIRTGKVIGIAGDYDADGITATALLVSYLTAKGAKVVYHIPARTEGYGLSTETIDRLVGEHGASLLITVDCGTSSRAEVEYAERMGATVIVTDHHPAVPGKEAVGIVVNPHAGGDTYANKGLCGASVAYKLAAAHHGSQVASNLDLVAMGAVADVMPLTGENRIMVWQGLARMAHTRRPGLAALLRTSLRAASKCRHGVPVCAVCPDAAACARVHSGVPHCWTPTAEDVGFQIGPRLNAWGRMGNEPDLVVEMLVTADPVRGADLAAQVDAANLARREMTNRLTAEALEVVGPDDPIVVYQADMFKGVAGLVANHIATAVNRPVIVLDLNGGGSARTSGDIDLLTVLREHFSHLITVAGHHQAMGVQWCPDPDALRAAIRAHEWPPSVSEPVLAIDAVCALSDMDDNLVEALRWLEPTGHGNPPAALAILGVEVAKVSKSRDKRHAFLTLRPRGGGPEMRAAWFGHGDDAPAAGSIVDVAGRPDVNTNPYSGKRAVEIKVADVRLSA